LAFDVTPKAIFKGRKNRLRRDPAKIPAAANDYLNVRNFGPGLEAPTKLHNPLCITMFNYKVRLLAQKLSLEASNFIQIRKNEPPHENKKYENKTYHED
jgi:hypothetical protein